eukprot:gene3337-4183_t
MKSFKIICFLLILTILIQLSFAHSGKRGRKIYVSSSSTCTHHCGSKYRPVASIGDAFSLINNYYPNPFDWLFDFSSSDDESDDEGEDIDQQYPSNFTTYYTIYVKPGTYSGRKNKGLTASVSMTIRSTLGSAKTIIDCEGNGNAMDVRAAQFQMSGFTIQNCRGSKGGAMGITQTMAILSDMVFKDNVGALGGALYIQSKSTSLVSSSFVGNQALENGAHLYFESASLNILNTKFYCSKNSPAKNEISCLLSSATFENTANFTNVRVQCDSCNFENDDTNYCGSTSTTCKDENPGGPGNPGETCQAPINSPQCVPDGVCDVMKESCLTCPQDCPSCSFNGFKLTTYVGCDPNVLKPECIHSITSVSTPSVVQFMKDVQACPITGVFEGYFIANLLGAYDFMLVGTNIGGRLEINGRNVIDAYFQHEAFNSDVTVQLQANVVNSLKIKVASFSSLDRNFTLYWKHHEATEYKPMKEIFFSQNVCNDKILDPQEKNKTSPLYCVADEKINEIVPAYCGDGICQEEFPELCIIDCYQHITPVCPAQATPSRIHQDYPVNDFTGSLLNNQYLYRLPGLEHLLHGFDIVSGEGKTTNLFSFGYCENVTKYSVLQDTNRGLVYTIPEEVFADFYPQCRYDAETSSYTSTSKMSSTMASQHSIQASAEASANIWVVQVNAKISFSKDKSVASARELETTKSGTIYKTEAKCLISKIQMHKYTFNPNFIADMAKVNTKEDMEKLVNIYGSHYYKSATMGGKLTRVTIMDSSSESKFQSNEVKEQLKLGFSLSVSTPIGSVEGSYSQTLDQERSTESQEDFTKSSASSTILTYGGAPGAYGPSTTAASISSFGDWASSVDLLPIPVDYELDAIGNIIPTTWLTRDGRSLRKLWHEAEELYYSKLTQIPPNMPLVETNYRLMWFFEQNRDHLSKWNITDATVRIKISGVGNEREPTELILMNDAKLPYNFFYAPAKWDRFENSTSPRYFNFRATYYETIKKMEVMINLPHDPDHNPAYLDYTRTTKIYMFDGRKLYRFLQESFEPVENVHTFMLMTVARVGTNSFHAGDSLEITFVGTLADYTTTIGMDNLFPSSESSKLLEITVPYFPNNVGSVVSLKFNYVSSVYDLLSNLYPCQYSIKEVYLSQRVCVDGDLEYYSNNCKPGHESRKKLKVSTGETKITKLGFDVSELALQVPQ